MPLILVLTLRAFTIVRVRCKQPLILLLKMDLVFSSMLENISIRLFWCMAR